MIRISGRMVRRLAALVVMLALVGALGVGALAWRLAQGPLPIDALARMMEKHFNQRDDGPRIVIGSAALAWEGFGGGGERPIEVRVADVQLFDADAVEVLSLPEGQVSLGLRALLLGRIEPRAISLTGLRIVVNRGVDGAVTLDLSGGGEAAAAAPGVGAPDTRPEGDLALLAELGLTPTPAGATPPRFAQLRRVAVHSAEITVDDRQLGAAWTVPDAELLVRRVAAAGGTALTLEASGVAQAGAARVPVKLQARLDPDGAADGELRFDGADPAAIAEALPRLGPLAAIDAPLTGTVSATRGADGTLAAARLRVMLAKGQVTLSGAAPLPVTSASLAARFTPSGITLDEAKLVLPGTHGPSPSITVTGTAAPEHDGSWRAEARVALDAVAAGDLPVLWPAGVAANPRRWIVANITGGVARDLSVTVGAVVPATLDAVVPDRVEGTMRGEGLVVHYLRPMPPVEGVAATLRLGLTTIDIEASGGQLGAITVAEGSVRLTDLDKPIEQAEVKLRIEAPIPAALALLSHPKLDLLNRRGAPPPGITGSGEVSLRVGFPLIDALSLDDLAVSVSARANDVRVPAILAGHDFERGRVELSADPAGLRFSGTGGFGAIAAEVGGEIDFRSGAPTQVVEKFTLRTVPQEGLAAMFGVDPAPYLSGPVGVDASLETRRNGQGTATVRADLTQARLAFAELGVQKAPGRPGTAEARATLAAGRLTGGEITRLDAGEIAGRARFVVTREGALERIEIPELRLGGSRIAGSVQLPQRGGGGYGVTLRAPVLDLSGRGAEASPPAAETDPAAPAPTVTIDATVDRVIVTPGHELHEVKGTGTYARGLIARADFTARAGERGTMRAQIMPEGQKRTLLLTADDAGAFLNAFDVVTSMAGGTLTVRGSYDDGTPGRPLTGNAELVDFRLRDAPAGARVLQAMTLYGALDLARGPGLNFSRALASFTLTDGALELRDARAFGSSLGFTAKGSIDRRHGRIDLEGTIVPAYFFNSLLGHIPLIGRIFSPEQGGGLFAATYRVRGPLNDPEASVNPLAALTPGFLRGLFGMFESGGQQTPPATPPADIPEYQRGG